jgi:hypothetical protein
MLFLLLSVALSFSFVTLASETLSSEKVETFLIKEIPEDIKVPRVLWDLIESKSKIKNGKIVLSEENARSSIEENRFVGIKVKLVEKTHGVLAGRNYELVSSKTGIGINLNQFVKSKQGSFLLTILPLGEINSVNTRVFFISNSKKRKIEGQLIGSGCSRFYDITDYFFKTLSKNGMEIAVSENRHVSLLGGSFIVVSEFEQGIRNISMVNFKDSNASELLCDSEQEEYK